MIADRPAQYESPPESIDLARATMRDIKAALTKGASGNFPAQYAEMRDGMNMQPPETALGNMDIRERYDLLITALAESIWSLERADRQELAVEFVKEEARQAMPGFRVDAFDILTARLEALTKEQTALAGKFGEFVGDAYSLIAKLAEVRPAASRDAFDRVVADGQENQRAVSPADLNESTGPESAQGRLKTHIHGITM